MAVSVYLGLVHYPVYNKCGNIITTAITNFDIHDIARAARTYGIERYFLIHPLTNQVDLAREILCYWQEGSGRTYNPDRCDALQIVDIVSDISAACAAIASIEGDNPIIVTTDARKYETTVSYMSLRNILKTANQPCLLLFGTGWGIEKSVMERFDYILEPVYGNKDYNHLSVRSAVSIILDRLLGQPWWE